MRLRLSHNLFGRTHILNEFYWGHDVGDEIAWSYLMDNCCKCLQDASGLKSFPDFELVTPSFTPKPVMEGSASFAMVMQSAAEVPDLQLPTLEVKTNVLMRVL